MERAEFFKNEDVKRLSFAVFCDYIVVKQRLFGNISVSLPPE